MNNEKLDTNQNSHKSIKAKPIPGRVSFYLILALAAFLMQCKESGKFNPTGPAARDVVFADLFATPDSIAVGGSRATISGRVIDQEGTGWVGVSVNFTASRGSVTSSTATDGNGAFTARYISGDVVGRDTVRISTEGASGVVTIFVSASSAAFTLEASAVSALANGMDTLTFTSTVQGNRGGLAGVNVHFTTTAGAFSGRSFTDVSTDSTGKAIALLIAPSASRAISGVVTAEVTDQLGAPRRTKSAAVRLRSGKVHHIDAADDFRSIPVTFRGVIVSATANPRLILGDGRATTQIRALVKEENQIGVPRAQLAFSAQHGSIPSVAQTDESGLAVVTLTGAPLPGDSDRVIIRYGPAIRDSVLISYVPAVARFTLSSDQPSFPADGTSGVTITAEVYDGAGQPSIGQEIIFTTSDSGTVFPERGVTDNEGKLTTHLVGFASSVDRDVVINGRVVQAGVIGGGSSERDVASAVVKDFKSAISAKESPRRDDLITTLTVRARGIQIELSSEQPAIIARNGSTTTISARVFETSTSNPVTTGSVRFSANLGAIPASGALDADGVARVAFNAREETGLATITGRFGTGLVGSTTVDLLPKIGGLTAGSDKSDILAGGIDTARITVQVFDPLGGPSPGAVVSLSIDAIPNDSLLATTDQTGLARFSIFSGSVEVDTAARVTLRSDRYSRTIRLGVRAITRRMSATPDSLSAGSQTPVSVTFQAFEATSHRPVTGDTIWFNAQGGVVQPFGVLDAQGIATTTFRAGGASGTAWVAGQLGILRYDSARVVLVDPVGRVRIIAGRSSLLANGMDTTTVAAQVTNLLNQPAPGTWLEFSSQRGGIAPAAAQTDQDGFVRAVFTADTSLRNVTIPVVVRVAGGRDTTPGFVGHFATAQPISTTLLQAGIDPAAASSFRGFSAGAPVRFSPQPVSAPLQLNSGSSDAYTVSSAQFAGFAPFKPLDADEIADSVLVTLRGITFGMRASPDSIRADGHSKSGVLVQVRETVSGAAITGARVRLGASLGSITGEGVTGIDGTYRDSLLAGVVPGLCELHALYGNELATSAQVAFLPDLNRQDLSISVSPDEGVAGLDSSFHLTASVSSDGQPSAGIAVRFTLESADWVLIDTTEHRGVTRYENTFRIADRNRLTGMQLMLQLRSVDYANTVILLNRTPLNNIQLPQSPIWGDYSFNLPVDQIFDGVNRIEIVGGQQGGISDRFSVAGVRLGAVGSREISRGMTDQAGQVEGVWHYDRVAGQVTFKAAFAEALDHSQRRTVVLQPSVPGGVRFATDRDTLLASGNQQSEFQALVVDGYGNPVTREQMAHFGADQGVVEPDSALTLGDGTAHGIYTAPMRTDDARASVTASVGALRGTYSVLLRGTRIRLTLPGNRMLADGTSRMSLQARLSTADGAPVSGRGVEFFTTLGAITPNAQTDNDGVAQATLTSADIAGTASIRVIYGQLADTAVVTFAPLIDQLHTTANPASMRADGLDSTTIQVQVVDGLDHGAANVAINLTASLGRLAQSRLTTDQNGAATTRLYGVASARDDSILVTASTLNGNHRDSIYVGLRGITITLRGDADSIAANGSATARFSAHIVETTGGNPVIGRTVNFSTDLGQIAASAVTDSSGLATAIFSAPIDSGTATIRARYGAGLEAVARIRCIDRVSYLTLSAEPNLLLANGVGTSQVIAVVTDAWGNGAPQIPVRLIFRGPADVSPTSGRTDAQGRFIATARSQASSSDGNLVITADVRDSLLVQTVSIELRGVQLRLSTDQVLIPNDGQSTATLTALLRETTTGHPLVGDTVRFTATSGTVNPFAVTDGSGEARATLRSDQAVAVARVTASYGNRLADSLNIAFAGRYSYLDLEASRSSLLADGLDTTMFTATVRDTLSRPVRGVMVRFVNLAGVGRLSADSAQTDVNGTASVIYRSRAAVRDEVGQIVARVGALSDTASVDQRGLTLRLTASTDSLPANGVSQATIIAGLSETGRGNPVIGRIINFSTDLGQIAASAVTDSAGLATAIFNAPIDAGTATIRGRNGAGLEATTRITCIDRVANLTLSVEPNLLLANGTATSQLTAVVTDAWGNGAPQIPVRLVFRGPANVSPTSGRTDAQGRLIATVRSQASSNDGSLVITADVRDSAIVRTASVELRGVQLRLATDQALIPNDGQSTATLTALLRETTTGHPLVGDTIHFTSTAGTVTPFVVTDESGEGRAILRSDQAVAVARVVASYGNRLADSLNIAFAGRYSYLDLEASRSSLLADGFDTTTFTATVRDTLSRPVRGVMVRFVNGAGIGNLSADSSQTDANGTARVIFRSRAAVRDEVGQIIARVGALSDTGSIDLRGLTLRLTASTDSLPANGVSQSILTASVSETGRGNPVIGRTVNFSTDLGVIEGTAQLDNNGRAAVTLRSPENPGMATVTASFGQALIAQHSVVFIPTVGVVSIRTDRSRLLGDGTDTTLCRVRVTDAASNPAGNVHVSLSAGVGSFTPAEVTTGVDGNATTLYTTGARVSDTTTTLRIVADGGATATTGVTIAGLTIALSADPNRISANGRDSSRVTANVTETTRHSPIVNRRISFAASSGSITGSALTDQSGVGAVTFTAPSTAGTSTIIGGFGDTLTAQTSITCVASAPAHVALSVSPTGISVAGVGRTETATLRAVVTDDRNTSVVDGSVLLLRIRPDIGVRFENGLDSIQVATQSGAATATVRSGNQPGAVVFRAYYQGNLLAEGAGLTVRTGPLAHLRVSPDLGTIEHPSGSLTAFPVSATATDAYTNPVADSTAVRFTLNPDTIATITGTGYTTNGVVQPGAYPAGVWLVFPSAKAGQQVWIKGSSVDVIDSVRVTLPGAVQGGDPARIQAAIDSSAITADGATTAQVTMQLTDAQGRPVSDLTEVDLTANLGTIQTPRYTADGSATALYRSGRVAGIDTIRIVSGNVTDYLTIRLRAGVTDSIALSRIDTVLRADGLAITTLTADLRDRFGNVVQTGTQVTFATTMGQITAAAQTNAQGRAVARFTSGLVAGIAQITATAGNANASTNILMVSGNASAVTFISQDRTGIGVRGSGQSESATLVYEVRDDHGVPVDSLHSVFVRFILDGPQKVINPDSSSADSVATLSPDSVLTDASGRATVTLQSGFFSGAVEISGAVGRAIRGRAISVAIFGGPPDSAHFSIHPSRCTLTGILGTVPDTTLMVVTIGDRFSNPVPPGTIVHFASTGGIVTGSSQTDSLGRCSALLRTVEPWPNGGIDTIYTQTVDYNNRSIRTLASVLVTGPTTATFDTTSGWAIPYGSYRNFTLTVDDFYLHSLTAGTTVQIAATATGPHGDVLTGATLTGDAVDNPVTLGECDFRSSFSVTLFNYVGGLDDATLRLTATVTSPNGDALTEITGTALGQVISPTLSRVILAPNQLVADGATPSTVTATIYDTLGIAIQNVSPDKVTISSAGARLGITQPTAVSDALGRSTGSVVAMALGTATVRVTVDGVLLNEQPQLSAIAGAPSAITALVLDNQLIVGGDTTSIIISVTDASGNSVIDGTSVTFQTTSGSISPFITTTTNGQVTAVLTSGNTSGAVTVTITATGQGANVQATIGTITYIAGSVASISLTANPVTIAVGGAVALSAACADQFGNAVGNTLITFEITTNPGGDCRLISSQVFTTAGTATTTMIAGQTTGSAVIIAYFDANSNGALDAGERSGNTIVTITP